jgi:hypothetical protein
MMWQTPGEGPPGLVTVDAWAARHGF